jgi:hypothetical protein
MPGNYKLEKSLDVDDMKMKKMKKKGLLVKDYKKKIRKIK